MMGAISEGFATIPANLGDAMGSWFDPLGLNVGDVEDQAEAAEAQEVALSTLRAASCDLGGLDRWDAGRTRRLDRRRALLRQYGRDNGLAAEPPAAGLTIEQRGRGSPLDFPPLGVNRNESF